MLKIIRNTLLESPRKIKQALAVMSDVVICAIAVQMAMDLRMETHVTWTIQHTLMFWMSVVFFLPIFIAMGLYRAIFRFVGLPFIYSQNKAIALYAFLYASVFTLLGIDQVPRSVGLLQPLVFGLGIVSSRLFVRYWLGGFSRNNLLNEMPKALIYGAGYAGRQLAGALLSSSDFRVVGFVDDDDRLTIGLDCKGSFLKRFNMKEVTILIIHGA
jgi:FlaA1/EpsC-like NDP-sugar epimerase